MIDLMGSARKKIGKKQEQRAVSEYTVPYQKGLREIICANNLSNVQGKLSHLIQGIMTRNWVAGIQQNFCMEQNQEMMLYVEEN